MLLEGLVRQEASVKTAQSLIDKSEVRAGAGQTQADLPNTLVTHSLFTLDDIPNPGKEFDTRKWLRQDWGTGNYRSCFGDEGTCIA
jgi:hypothetical protein